MVKEEREKAYGGDKKIPRHKKLSKTQTRKVKRTIGRELMAYMIHTFDGESIDIEAIPTEVLWALKKEIERLVKERKSKHYFIGDKIKYLLAKHEMSTSELSRLSGVNRRSIIFYKEDSVMPKPETIEKFNKIFGVDFDFWINQNEDEFIPTEVK